MTKEEVKALIRSLAEATLEEAYTSGLVAHRGSFCEGAKYRNTVEHSEKPFPHICLYPIGEIGSPGDVTSNYQILMGFYDYYPVADTNAAAYSELQDRMEALLRVFRTRLKNATDKFGAPLSYTVLSSFEEDKFDVYVGTGKSFQFNILNESTGLC